MTTTTDDIANAVTTIAESLGLAKLSPSDAVDKLCSELSRSAELNSATAIWQLSNFSNNVLAKLLPEKSEVFVPAGDRSGPAGTERIDPDFCIKIVIRAIMTGLKLFDVNDVRKSGACELLNHCPNPIKKSATPFVDTKGQWDHTHTTSGEI